MKYGNVVGLDKKVSRLVFGSIPLKRIGQEKAFEVLTAFQEAGGNAIDLAHIYGGGEHSRIFGEYLKTRNREDWVILDKGCHPYGSPRFGVEFSLSDLEDELERTGAGSIDLWVFHRDEPEVDLLPVLQHLNDEKAKGRIQAWGGSNWSLARIREANRIAEEHGLQGFTLNNPNLTLAHWNEPMWAGCLSTDAETKAFHTESQMPLFSWSSVANGFFAGIENDEVKRVWHNEGNFARRERTQQLGKELGATPTQVALAWVLNQPFPTFPLIGCDSVDQVKENVAAVEIELSPEQLRWLEHGD